MKILHRSFSILFAVLFFLLLLTPALTINASAEGQSEGEGKEVLHIETKEDFISFAKNCSLDTYSVGLTVSLDSSIDFGGEELWPVPTFSGTFEGNGNAIRGFTLATDGSHQGLFRYLQKSGSICNLKVEGTVSPDDSRCEVGGIVGMNYGTIENCSFDGTVSGMNYVGGIAGVSYGSILNCKSEGTVSGKRFTGGIAGYSDYLISNCTNLALVNTTITEGAIEVENLSVSSITDGLNFISAEDTNVVSDTGGIVGYSKGTVENCTNRANIGYQHYGYNIGGICGRQSGYVNLCVNEGTILGRKDVGGIVGQMEPNLIVEDTTILSDALNNLNWAVSVALNNASANSANVTDALQMLQSNAQSAGDKIQWQESEVVIGGETYKTTVPYLTEEGQATVETDLDNMLTNMQYLNKSLNELSQSSASDLENVNAQAGVAIGLFANVANGNISTSIYEDTSLEGAESDVRGKVAACTNSGTVDGDINIGGIGGTMAVEYDFDMEGTIANAVTGTLQIDTVSSITYEAKCVCYEDKNSAAVTAKKDYSAGICGYQDLGAILGCENYGDVTSESGYVGGIAGSSNSVIDNCYSMCNLYGKEYVGGIAGIGTKINDCVTLVRMDNVTACFGAIAGYADVEETSNISGNRFINDRVGAIDGISYSGLAEPTDYSVIEADESIPEAFKDLTLTFRAGGNIVKVVHFKYGESIPSEEIPAVPAKTGYSGKWPCFDCSAVYFSDTLDAVYTPHQGAVSSELLRNGTEKSLVVLSGEFSDASSLSVTPYSGDLPSVSNAEVTEAWNIQLLNAQGQEEYQVRFCMPETDSFHRLELWEKNGKTWEKVETETLGSYVAFNTSKNELYLCVLSVENIVLIVVLIIAAAVLLFLLIFLFIRVVRKIHLAKNRKRSHLTNNK